MTADQTVTPTQKRIHPVDEVLALPRLAAYGCQHVLACYAVLEPILLASVTGLIEIAKIANYRFDDLVANANPIASARGAAIRAVEPVRTGGWTS